MRTDSGGDHAGVVFGLITMGALLAAESSRRETYPEAITSATIALLLYWFAHSYAGLLGEHLSRRQRLTPKTIATAFVGDWSIARGASLPLVALLITWAAGGGRQTAVNVALWSCAGWLIAFEVMSGIRAKATLGELIIETAAGVAMGLAIVSLKFVLH